MLTISIFRDKSRTQIISVESQDKAATIVAKFFDYLLHDGYRMVQDSHAPLMWHFVHRDKEAVTIEIEKEIHVIQQS